MSEEMNAEECKMCGQPGHEGQPCPPKSEPTEGGVEEVTPTETPAEGEVAKTEEKVEGAE